MTTGQRMKLRRKELKISAEEVAKVLGVSPATVYRYEKGDIEKVPGEILEPLAQLLNTTPSWLMGWDDSAYADSHSEAARLKNEASARLDAEERELNEYLNELKNNPGMRILFSKTKGAKKEDIEKVIKMLDIMRGSEDGTGYY